MKPIKCPVPVTHALEAWAMSRAARSLRAHQARVATSYPHLYLQDQAAKYAALAAKEQERIAASPCPDCQHAGHAGQWCGHRNVAVPEDLCYCDLREDSAK